jgi:hypothetical protein
MPYENVPKKEDTVSTLEKRLVTLEQRIPLRCPSCKSELQCAHCNDWKAVARAYGLDPEALVETIHSAMLTQLAGGTANAEATH